MALRALQSYARYFSTLNKVAFSAVLEGPQANYMGMMLTDADEEKLDQLSDPFEKDRFIKDRIKIARCQTEIDMIKVGFKFDTTHLRPHWYPLKSYSIVEVAVDKCEIAGKLINGVPYLIAGDALVTVDPMTGLGCNNAITTSEHFERILSRMEMGCSSDACVRLYQELSNTNIHSIHQISKQTRQQYSKF